MSLFLISYRVSLVVKTKLTKQRRKTMRYSVLILGLVGMLIGFIMSLPLMMGSRYTSEVEALGIFGVLIEVVSMFITFIGWVIVSQRSKETTSLFTDNKGKRQ
jgi:uncharacterized protein YacL